MPGFDALERVVRRGEQAVYTRRTRSPCRFGAYCGCQKLFTFGSLPTMKSRRDGKRRATVAVQAANWPARAAEGWTGALGEADDAGSLRSRVEA